MERFFVFRSDASVDIVSKLMYQLLAFSLKLPYFRVDFLQPRQCASPFVFLVRFHTIQRTKLMSVICDARRARLAPQTHCGLTVAISRYSANTY